MDIWTKVGGFISEHYMIGTIVGLILLAVALFAQIAINSSLEEDLIELTERVEAVEKKCGIEVQNEDSKEEK